jgi:hypothetical protein
MSRHDTIQPNDEGNYRLLAAEFNASQPAIAQTSPQDSFCQSHVLAHLFCALLDGGGSAYVFGFH